MIFFLCLEANGAKAIGMFAREIIWQCITPTGLARAIISVREKPKRKVSRNQVT